MIKVEICLNGIESAIAAQAGGAHRVELCDNLMEGGTSPSIGTVEAVREQLNIEIMAMVRPRGGDFLYSEHEFKCMQRDIAHMHSAGVDGVVFGMLNADGSIDVERTKNLIDLARPMQVTFHRAFDMSSNAMQALDALLDCGVDRILTSGHAPSAMEGLSLIAKLQSHAGNNCIILPAVNITAENARKIVASAKLKELHIGSNVETLQPSRMQFQNQTVSMGDDTSLPEYAMPRTNSALVAEVVKSVNP
ncbi:MAG: hypothetical protein KTR17_11880 [Cellvibrionaceae bacterium]|nr:hypothetical protein [Cellvibrionaceae bacterium]